MMRTVACWTLLWMLAVPLAVAANTYSAYHDSTAQTSTALVVSNAGGEAGTATCSVYDADGSLIVATSVALAAHASQVVFVDDLLLERGATTWGLLRLESPMDLAIAVWISASGVWVVAENLEPTGADRPIVQIANYASTPNRTTGIGLVNPFDRGITGTLVLYDAQGAIAGSTEFELEPRVARYVRSASDVGQEEAFWGLLVVDASAPVLLGLEYYDGGGALIDVDVLSAGAG
ncbi:MAG: hypothetical protein PHW86_00245 [Candidatus Bipolaricaulis sp.]|nr:hypothetical protein [Candidatus Bipolaricaulis sp.]